MTEEMNKKPEGPIKFAILSTDIVCFRIVDGTLRVLLETIGRHPYFEGYQAAIGGILLPKETSEEAAERLLREKAGISHIYKEQLFTFSQVDRDPRGRVVSVAYLALAEKEPRITGEGSRKTEWVPVPKIPKLAYDHDGIVKTALERLRSRVEYTTIIQHLLPSEFTMTDLQNAYEIVLAKKLDKRNFRKKILALKVLKDTKRVRREGRMRPATLYSFKSPDVKFIEIL